jgi:hypothetical protein
MTNDLRELVEEMEPHSPPEPTPQVDTPALDTWETDGGAPPPLTSDGEGRMDESERVQR